MKLKKYKFILENWKMIVHLLFRTQRFGVNNQWWSTFDSIFGWDNKKKIMAVLKVKPLILNYKMMFVRSAIGFIPYEDFLIITPKRQLKRLIYNKK